MSAAERKERIRAKILMSPEERIKKLERMFATEHDACHQSEDKKELQQLNQTVVGLKDNSEINATSKDHAFTHLNECSESQNYCEPTLSKESIPFTDDSPAMELLPEAEVEEMEDENVLEKHKDKSSQSTVSLFHTLFILLFGVFVRLAITSKFSSYVQNLVYPFVALQISIFGYHYTLGTDATGGYMLKSGLWISIFHLLGFNQQLIDAYGQIMGCLYSVMDDFTVYLFAFVLAHSFLYS